MGDILRSPDADQSGGGIKPEPEKSKEDLARELFVPEVPPQYKEFMNYENFLKDRDSFAEHLVRHLTSEYVDKETREFVAQKMKGGVVLDLGCGGANDTVELSRQLGARRYMGVDVKLPVLSHFGIEVSRPVDHGNLKPSERPVRLEKNADGSIVFIESDMLNLAARLETESVDVIFIAGIEGNYRETEEYRKFLNTEIERILKKGGIVINYNSDIAEYDTSSLVGVKQINDEADRATDRILEKK